MSSYQRCEVLAADRALELRVTLVHSDATLPMPADTPNLLRLLAEGPAVSSSRDPFDDEEVAASASQLLEAVSVRRVDVAKRAAVYRLVPTSEGASLLETPVGATWEAAADVDSGAGQALIQRQLWRDPKAAIALGQQGDPAFAEAFALMLTDGRPEVATRFRRSALIALGWLGPAALPIAEEPLYELEPTSHTEELAHRFAEWRVLGNPAAKDRLFKVGNDTDSLKTMLFEAPCALLDEMFEIASAKPLKAYLNPTIPMNRAKKRCGGGKTASEP